MVKKRVGNHLMAFCCGDKLEERRNVKGTTYFRCEKCGRMAFVKREEYEKYSTK